jgi:hypothetical protein
MEPAGADTHRDGERRSTERAVTIAMPTDQCATEERRRVEILE